MYYCFNAFYQHILLTHPINPTNQLPLPMRGWLPQGVLLSVHAIQMAESNGRGGFHTMLVANIISPSARIAVTKVLIPVKLPR